MNKPSKDERRRRTQRRNIPVGLEQVLFVAASDEAFREALLEDRTRALEAWGLRLRDSELRALGGIPDVQLRTVIAAVDTSSANVERRDFLRAVAASVAVVTAGQVAGGCDDTDDANGGSTDAAVPDQKTFHGDTGVRPDRPMTDLAIQTDSANPDMGMRDAPKPDIVPHVDQAAADKGEPDYAVLDSVPITVDKLRVDAGVRD